MVQEDGDGPGGEVSTAAYTSAAQCIGPPSGSPPFSPHPYAPLTLSADTVGRSISGELAIIL